MNLKGNLNIIKGNNLDYMATVQDDYFDLAVVDPPYGIGMDGGNVGYKGKNNFKKKDWDKSPPEKAYFDELFRISKNQIIWGGNYFGLPPTRCFLVWDKGEGFYNRTYAECELAWTSFDRNTVKFKRDPLAKGDYKGKIHPTQKPLELYRWIYKKYATPEMKIIDTHLGSGSSAIEAFYFGFSEFVGLEIDNDYYDRTTKRILAETQQIRVSLEPIKRNKKPRKKIIDKDQLGLKFQTL